ncbi:hypothetical protein DRF60_12130 [Chryseobacterium elymi]|uniref:Uncharacterized protein n=1 Tax=Chryseobacterium elymi TaxID=395936 RepID=A0A3D9DGQ2_9FLAO|nr:hypothetical protein [Chryseobacterium elymi]REC77153.1 hypothetical protein DRF60_12130 [Chryseobacterium elymi]
MLFAWQIENLSTTSLAVQNSTVSYCLCKFTEHSEKDKAPVNNDFIEMSKLYADARHWSLLCRDAEIVQQYKYDIHSVEDPKIEKGDFIIKFPDKLS